MVRSKARVVLVEREKKIYCGDDWLEVDIYPAYHQSEGRGRRARVKESCPAQRNLNDKNARKYFIRLVHTNFTSADYRLDLTYNRESCPETPEELARNGRNFLRRLADLRRKLGLTPLKYVLINAYGISAKTGRMVRPHHHLIVNGGLSVKEIMGLWKRRGKNGRAYGFVSYAPLQFDPDTGIAGLANYLAEQPAHKKRWSSSANLRKPESSTNDSRYRKRQVERMIASEAYKAYGSDCRNLINYEQWCSKYSGYRLVGYSPEYVDGMGAWYLSMRFRKNSDPLPQNERRLKRGRAGVSAPVTKTGCCDQTEEFGDRDAS